MTHNDKLLSQRKHTKGVSLKESVWQELDVIARAEKRSRNNLIGAILEEYLEQRATQKKKEQQLSML